MKKSTLILSTMAVSAMVSFTSCQTQSSAPASDASQQTEIHKGAVVYFDLDRVLNEYDMANDLSSAVQTKLQSIDQEVTRRGNKLQSDVNSFQEKIDKGLLTRSVAEVQSQKLQEQEAAFNNYMAEKQAEMQEEQAVMMNQIGDAIKSFLDKYNEEKKFALIIANQGGILPQPVAAADPELDITDDIIAGLNAEYIQIKNKK